MAGNDTHHASKTLAWPLRLPFGAIGNSVRRSHSIRSRLIQIVFFLVAPAVVGLAALASSFYQNERAQISQSLFSTAHALSSALDRDLSGTIAAARVLAESSFLASDDLANFHREATKVLPLFPGYAIVLSDQAGRQLANTFRPYGEPLPLVANQANHRKVFETGQPSVSDLFIGAISKQQAVFVYVPVLRNNRVKYSLGVAISPSRLNDLLQHQQLPSGWVSAITDSSDVLVAHSRVPALVGQIPPVRPSATSSSQPGMIETFRTDGTPIFVGFSKSEISGWSVAISVPIAAASRQPNAILLYGGVGVLGVLIVGLILAARESARIGRAVNNLIAPALALGRGEPPLIPPLNVRETDEVAHALGRAHQLLQKRTEERDTAELNKRSLADEMFRLAVEACPSGMVMIDRDGKMVMVNTEVEHQFGYTCEELIGQPVDMLVPERFREQHARHRHQFTPAPETRHMGAGRDLFGRRKDGTEFAVEVGLNPIRAGDHLVVLGVIVDISQRKQMERLKDEFVATVSHELRTPMTSIAGSLGLLMGQWSGQLPETAVRLLTIAHTNSQRLVRLINDILDIEKIESGRAVFNFVRADLRQVAVQTIKDNSGFAEGFGIKVRMAAGMDDTEVSADPDRLAQVITNLLSNAIKFSPPAGEVLVTVEEKADMVRLSVRDHGSGIPEDFKSRIFEKFAQADGTNSRQKSGTGLGLSIVKQIVERLNGQVGFEDARGGGTVFYVELPRWADTAGVEIDAAAEGSPPRILLCEDDPAVAKVVRMRLRRAGFTVDYAHTVDTAIARSDTNRYAAIIVDLLLRGGDGIDLITQIRTQSHHSTTPILVISGDPERGRGDVRSSQLNILNWFNKPIDFGRLTDVLVAATTPASRARPRILHVDDDRDTLAAVACELDAMAEVVSVDSMEAALRALAADSFDLVVLDIALGQDSGLNLSPDIRDRSGNAIPVIIFSCHGEDVSNDDRLNAALSKMNSPLENLGATVRDRLRLSPPRAVKEVA